MFSQLAHLRPGTLAKTNQAIDKLTADQRELKRMAALLAEQQRAFETATADTAVQIQDLKEQLARISLRESQLRTVLESDVAQQRLIERLPPVLKEKRIAKIVQAAVDRAELRLDPFPHMVVEDMFPRGFYKALVKGIPPLELFEDNAVNHQQLRVPFALAPMFSRQVWKFMVEIADTILGPILTQKFRAPLEEWIVENWPQMANDPLGAPMSLHSTGGRIMLRRRGYNIPTHRDPKWGFITCLMYLARPGDRETWGTSLYDVDEDIEAPGVQPHWINAKNCRLVREVPFKANSALVFLNSRGAHGASIPEDAEPADLERYAYQFRIGPTRDSIKALMEMLPEARRPVWAGKFEG